MYVCLDVRVVIQHHKIVKCHQKVTISKKERERRGGGGEEERGRAEDSLRDANARAGYSGRKLIL